MRAHKDTHVPTTITIPQMLTEQLIFPLYYTFYTLVGPNDQPWEYRRKYIIEETDTLLQKIYPVKKKILAVWSLE